MSLHWKDRLALTSLAEILKEHLQAGENPQDPGLLLSDRVQAVINILTEDVFDPGAYRLERKPDADGDR